MTSYPTPRDVLRHATRCHAQSTLTGRGQWIRSNHEACACSLPCGVGDDDSDRVADAVSECL